MDYEIKRLDFSEEQDMDRLIRLQNAVYEGRHVFTRKTFQFWYLDNPCGRVLSYNAVRDGELAAHYALIPMEMNIGGRIAGKPVSECLQKRTLDFIFRGLATVPPALRDLHLQQQILDELDGNFLPRRNCENGGAPALQRYRRQLARLRTRWNSQLNLAN